MVNRGVVVNLGERQGEVTTKLGSNTRFLMSFHVVEVHKPLLAVSRPVEAGCKVHFDKDVFYMLMATGEKIPMICTGFTCELVLWIRNPCFTQQSGR